MRSSLALDPLDRQILHALEIDGRAPFRRLASIFGASEQTVARRYRRLHDAGVIRVLVLPALKLLDQGTLPRIQVQPGAARPLANALAERLDVSWIGLMAGGSEIGRGVRARTHHARDTLLLDRLPRTGRGWASRPTRSCTTSPSRTGPVGTASTIHSPQSSR